MTREVGELVRALNVELGAGLQHALGGDPQIEIVLERSLDTFKVFLFDEAWLFIKNETIRNYVVQAKKLGAN